MRQFSLAHLTALAVPPPRLIEIAARCGYDAVGLRLIAVNTESPGYALMDDRAMMRETQSALKATGLRVHDIEFVKLTPEIDIAALEPFFAAGHALGACHAIAAPYDPDLNRLGDRFAAFCALAKRYGLGGMLEFFPWTVVPDLLSANAILDHASADNAGILVDALHFDRSGSSYNDLKAIAPRRLPYLHLCDAPAERPGDTETLLHQARAERLPPGEGGLDLVPLIAAMPPDCPIALEVPMTMFAATHGAEAVAARALQAARKLVDMAAHPLKDMPAHG